MYTDIARNVRSQTSVFLLTCFLVEDENLEHNSDVFAVHGSPRSAEEALANHKVPVLIPYYGDHLKDPDEGLKYNKENK